jgi:hypothetical protein
VERIRLDQDAIEIQTAEQLFQRRMLTGFVGVLGLLGQGDAKSSGVHRDLGHKTVVALLRLDRRAPQGLAITDQLVQMVLPTWDLAARCQLRRRLASIT